MQEKPVLTTKSLSKTSLWLGILAALVSLPVLLPLWMVLPGLMDWFFMFLYYGAGFLLTNLVSLGFGLAGIITGSVALKRKIGKPWHAVVGILLGSLAILVAVGSTVIIFTVPGWGM